MKKVLAAGLVLAVMAMCVAPAVADVAVSFTACPYSLGFNGSYGDCGFSFTPTVDLTLNALGYFQQDPAVVGYGSIPGAVHSVAIYSGNWVGGAYNGTGTLVATVDVVTGAAPVGTYSWTTLAGGPVTLAAGTTYTLAANPQVAGVNGNPGYIGESAFPNSGNEAYPNGSFTNLVVDPDLGYIAGSGGQTYAASSDLPLSGPTIWGTPDTGYFAGNLQYDVAAAPEPATMSLLGLGLVGLLARRKK